MNKKHTLITLLTLALFSTSATTRADELDLSVKTEAIAQKRFAEVQARLLDIEVEDLRQHGKRQLIAGGVIGGVALLGVVATIASLPKPDSEDDYDARVGIGAAVGSIAGLMVVGVATPLFISGGVKRGKARRRATRARQLHAGFSATKTGGALNLSGNF